MGNIFIPDYQKENDLRDRSCGCLWVELGVAAVVMTDEESTPGSPLG